MANILLVEDDENIGRSISQAFLDAGHQVDWAQDGEAALQALRLKQPDIMLLDILLPKRSGFDILKELQRDSALAHPPVVVLSSSGEKLEKERAKQLGAIDYLIKTEITPKDLVPKIMMYLPQDAQLPPDAGGVPPAPAPVPGAQPPPVPEPGASSETLPAPVPSAATAPATEGGPAVLVVEDDKFLRDLIVQKLKREQFSVHEAVTGSEALRVAKETLPKIVLLDLILPGLDGFEVLKRLKEDSATAQIPVIILSNLGQREDVERGLRLGAVDFMIKAHFTPGEIVEKIKEILSRTIPA